MLLVDSSEDSSDFRNALSRSTGSKAQKAGKDKPGQLYEDLVAVLEEELGRRGGAVGRQGANWKRYISAALSSKGGYRIPKSRLAELYDKAEALEKLEVGALSSGGKFLTRKLGSAVVFVGAGPPWAQSALLLHPVHRRPPSPAPRRSLRFRDLTPSSRVLGSATTPRDATSPKRRGDPGRPAAVKRKMKFRDFLEKVTAKRKAKQAERGHAKAQEERD